MIVLANKFIDDRFSNRHGAGHWVQPAEYYSGLGNESDLSMYLKTHPNKTRFSKEKPASHRYQRKYEIRQMLLKKVGTQVNLHGVETNSGGVPYTEQLKAVLSNSTNDANGQPVVSKDTMQNFMYLGMLGLGAIVLIKMFKK